MGQCLSLGSQKHYTAMITHFHTHTHKLKHTRPSSLMLLISIITSPRYEYIGITTHVLPRGALRQGEQTAAIQGAVRRKRGGGVMACVCVGREIVGFVLV